MKTIQIKNGRDAFFFVLRVINAMFTYAFASQFLYLVVPFTDPGQEQFARIIAGIIAVIATDLASIIWNRIYVYEKDVTQEQRVIAHRMSNASLVASSAATFVQVIFNAGELVDLSAWYFYTGLIAVIGFGAIIVAHFYYSIKYNEVSPDASQAEQEAAMTAELFQKSLAETAKRLANDASWVADRRSEAMRQSMLRDMNLDPETRNFIGSGEGFQSPQLPAVAGIGGGGPATIRPRREVAHRYQIMHIGDGSIGTHDSVPNLRQAHDIADALGVREGRNYFVVDTHSGSPVDDKGNPIGIEMIKETAATDNGEPAVPFQRSQNQSQSGTE